MGTENEEEKERTKRHGEGKVRIFTLYHKLSFKYDFLFLLLHKISAAFETHALQIRENLMGRR